MASFTLLGGRLTLLNVPPRPAEDALWLAASLPALPPHAAVLDAACGCGVAGLALLARQPGLRITALDIEPSLTELAAKNAMLNTLPLRILTADVLALPPLGPFAAILCNPPFYPAETHPASHTQARAKSLPPGQLHQWLAALTAVLQPGGTLHLVLHSACQPQLTAFAQAHACALTVTPLAMSPTLPPKRLLAALQPGSGHTLAILPPVAAHDATVRQSILLNANGLY
jgi:tRNA1(Val) A37 N6-methylase TrmN6